MNSYRWVLIEEAKELSASPDLHLLRQRVLTISVFILLIFILLTPCTVFVPLCLHLNSTYWLLAVRDGDIAHLDLYFYSLFSFPFFK